MGLCGGWHQQHQQQQVCVTILSQLPAVSPACAVPLMQLSAVLLVLGSRERMQEPPAPSRWGALLGELSVAGRHDPRTQVADAAADALSECAER